MATVQLHSSNATAFQGVLADPVGLSKLSPSQSLPLKGQEPVILLLSDLSPNRSHSAPVTKQVSQNLARALFAQVSGDVKPETTFTLIAPESSRKVDQTAQNWLYGLYPHLRDLDKIREERVDQEPALTREQIDQLILAHKKYEQS